MIGSTIGNYRITERIGGGGIGEVWKAVDLGLDRVVAIKALRPELAIREQVVARFRSEAQTLARLNHPNIATLHTLLENRETLFMVMEYVKGQTLSSLIRAAGRFEPDTAFEIFQQTLDGIGHAHEVGVVHRDIKGSNLMVDDRGVVKIMDFGIARVMGSGRMTRHGFLVGTPEFMSPEQVRGEEATVQSDIYSLGVLLYEMLTGRVPFEKKGDFDLMQAQVGMAPPPPRSLAPEIPEAIEVVMLCALEKKPESRYRTTEAFQEALRCAGAPSRGTSSIRRLSAALAGEREGDPEDPTLETDAGDSGSAGTTQLILEEVGEDGPNGSGSGTRPSRRWSRLAAGAALVGMALGTNVLSTHPRVESAALGGAETAAPTAVDESGPALPGEALLRAPWTPAEQASEGKGPNRTDLDLLSEAQSAVPEAKAPRGKSGAEPDPGGAPSDPSSAAARPAPPRNRAAANGKPHTGPKRQRRSSEENPGWVIRRE
jgi:serine/threonine-protein kinase